MSRFAAPIAEQIWDMKYRLKAPGGEALDHTVEDTWRRVARALASDPGEEQAFYAALEDFKFLPAGRITAGAGTGRNVTLFNCFVMGTIPDSMGGIFDMLKEAALTMQQGGGIGYDFSTIRPRGADVKGVAADASGPLSFMDVWDAMCRTIMSAGSRRGAMMATMRCDHPDIEDFIAAKSDPARLRMFNMSVLVTDDFMQAVQDGKPWELKFGGRVYRTLEARDLWNRIMRATYDYAEPGVIFIDRINRMNNLNYCETIAATNPCGEQPLPPYGACLLGSINLTKFVCNPFTPEARFDWERFGEVVAVFTRMLDNVVEINGLPLQAQRDEILRKRRHGMGYLGLGSAMTMMCMRYGSEASLEFTEQVTKTLALEGWRAGLALANEKGPAPIMDEAFTVTAEMLAQRPEMAVDGWQIGDRVKGRVLFSKYSRYMQRLAEEDPALVEALSEIGSRFTHHSSIAPTGTISLSLANNASNGIEPSFAHHYARNIIREGKKSKEKVDVFSYELLAYREWVNAEAMPYAEEPGKRLPDYFISADEVTPKQHVDVQAAAQKWIDSSISKTANVPTDYSYEDFKDIYLYAYEQGLKGCTTFRFNPEAFQGVLVKEQDLENTTYCFTLADGSVVEAKGNEEIEYDGEIHTAANLFDALKEGYYGKL